MRSGWPPTAPTSSASTSAPTSPPTDIRWPPQTNSTRRSHWWKPKAARCWPGPPQWRAGGARGRGRFVGHRIRLLGSIFRGPGGPRRRCDRGVAGGVGHHPAGLRRCVLPVRFAAGRAMWHTTAGTHLGGWSDGTVTSARTSVRRRLDAVRLGPQRDHDDARRSTLPPDFEVVLASPRLDPTGDPARCAHKLVALRESGATMVTCSVTATSAGHYCEQLVALRDLADDLGS